MLKSKDRHHDQVMMTQSQHSWESELAPRPARYFASVGSSNDVALEWLRRGAPAGAVVVADEQTQGRGRLGRSWYAPPGSALMVSIILRPDRDALTRVPMLGAVAVAEALEHLGAAQVGIKWPNDVRMNGRKVCGVLPEAAWDGDRLLGVALGIGINVRIDFRGTPMQDTAISLEPAMGRLVDRLALLKQLLERVDAWSAELASDSLYAAWKQRLTMLGGSVAVTSGDGVVQGIAEAVDATGALLVRTHDGALRRMIAGDLALGEQGQTDGN